VEYPLRFNLLYELVYLLLFGQVNTLDRETQTMILIDINTYDAVVPG